jgi:hypothetical protein
MTRKGIRDIFRSKCGISTFDLSIPIQRKLYYYADVWRRNMNYFYRIIDAIALGSGKIIVTRFDKL